MNLFMQKTEIKENITKVLFLSLKKIVLKENGKKKMNQLKKHILFFDFLENYYVSKDEVSKHHLNVIKKSNFVKEDKTIVRSSHPPLEKVLLTCKKTEVKASPFKIANVDTPLYSIIEQNNFTNESLYVIGQ